jgi:hypothetical protein
MEAMKKVSWNASEGLIMEISNRRVSANTWFINGNLRRAFNTLTAIKQSVIQSFAKPERVKLKELEIKFGKISVVLTSAFSSSFNGSARNLYSQAYHLGLKFYSEYNDLLMDLLEDRGYLIGEQSDASKMKF